MNDEKKEAWKISQEIFKIIDGKSSKFSLICMTFTIVCIIESLKDKNKNEKLKMAYTVCEGIREGINRELYIHLKEGK